MPPEPTPRGGTLRRVHLLIRSNWISSAGAALATLALLAGLTGWALQSADAWSGPYVGIVTVLVLPALFVVGLLLIPLGLLLYRGQLEQRIAALADRPLYLGRAIAILTVVNFAGIGTLGYAGVHYMSSVQFCGTACHVMDAEYVTYQTSAHAHVECVACHVGPGATWMIKSKINGARQLIGYATDTYNKPIPTPVHDLRSARETCERCHWPEKYLGTKLMVRPRFRDDQNSSGYVNVLLMRTGGTRLDGANVGIHWHTNPEVEIDFVATDARRREIAWVRVRDRDGSERIYTAAGVDPAHPPAGEMHRMDCSDCHNRSAHAFELPQDAVDKVMAAGLISRRLPFIKKHAVEVLQMDWTRDGADSGIREAMLARYNEAGMLDAETRPLLEPAIQQLVGIWQRNVYPERKLHWGTYPDFKTHEGCMRCHAGALSNPNGVLIPTACDKCHVVLSNEEESPAILDALGLGSQR